MKDFDFRSLTQPTWKMTLPDATVLHIKQPTQFMVKHLQASYEDIKGMKNDKDAMHRAYDLVAELMSNNEEGFTLTGKQLNLKYHIPEWQLSKFVNQYFQFVREISGAKN